jgi:hypothetical protein
MMPEFAARRAPAAPPRAGSAAGRRRRGGARATITASCFFRRTRCSSIVSISASSVSYSCVSARPACGLLRPPSTMIASMRAALAARFASNEAICSCNRFHGFPSWLDCDPEAPGEEVRSGAPPDAADRLTRRAAPGLPKQKRVCGCGLRFLFSSADATSANPAFTASGPVIHVSFFIISSTSPRLAGARGVQAGDRSVDRVEQIGELAHVAPGCRRRCRASCGSSSSRPRPCSISSPAIAMIEPRMPRGR